MDPIPPPRGAVRRSPLCPCPRPLAAGLPGFCPRRTSRRTWEEAHVRARVTPLLRMPCQRVGAWAACGRDPLIIDAKVPLGGAAPLVQNSPLKAGGSPQLLAPPTTQDCYTIGSHSRHLDTAWSPMPLVPQNYRAHGLRSSTEREGLPLVILRGGCRAHTPWLRADNDPHADHPCGRGGLFESTESIQGTRLPREMKDAPSSGSGVPIPSPSAKDQITQETLTFVTSILCPSVVLIILCSHLTSGHIQNTAAASCNLAVDDNEMRVISMYCYLHCDPGPNTPERNQFRLVYCCPKCEFRLNAPGTNHPCLVGLLIVWTCAAPFSEGLPARYPSSRATVNGPREVRFAEATNVLPLVGESSGQRQLVAAIGEDEDSAGAGHEPWDDVDTATYDEVTVAALCHTGGKRVIPIRRVNQSCTAEWKRECEESILIDLHSRPEVRCSERDAWRRAVMPLGAPRLGERRGRTRCDEIGILWFPRGPWLWHARHDRNCVATFMSHWPNCRDLNLVVAVTSEQNDLVSSLFYKSIRLFSPHRDLTVTDLSWWKGTTLFCRLKSSWETQERVLRTPQGSDHTPASPWAIVTVTILPESPFPSTPLLPAPDSTTTTLIPSYRADMGLRANLCVLLLGLVITSSTSRIHRSTTLGSLIGLLSVLSADRFTLRNGYGTVEARYHLTAYDCSDPSEVQAYSSIPASH